MKTIIRILVVTLLVLTAGCAPVITEAPTLTAAPPPTAVPTAAAPKPSATLPPPAPTFTPLPPTSTVKPTQPSTAAPTPSAAGLSTEALKNMSYTLPVSQKTVTLVDGQFDLRQGNERLSAQFVLSASGDLNGDGAADAAVILSENTGGTGNFKSLFAVLNQGGRPVQAAAIYLGDRWVTNSAVVQNGLISLDLRVQGPNDGLCCPSQPITQAYRFTGSRLTLVNQVSFTSGGDRRAIKITQPADGSTVEGTLQVQGRVTIAPFENNLAVRFYSLDGKVIFETSLMVQAASMGGPGSINSTIDISRIAAGTTFRMALVDVSAADGSTLALDSVQLTRK